MFILILDAFPNSVLFLCHFCWQATVLVTHIYVWNVVEIPCHLTLSKMSRVVFSTTVYSTLWFRSEPHPCLPESSNTVKWLRIMPLRIMKG